MYIMNLDRNDANILIKRKRNRNVFELNHHSTFTLFRLTTVTLSQTSLRSMNYRGVGKTGNKLKNRGTRALLRKTWFVD